MAPELTSAGDRDKFDHDTRRPCRRGSADFTPTPSMHARLDLVSAVLGDGRVLFAGGEFLDAGGNLDNVSFAAGPANDRSTGSPCDTLEASRTSRSRRERMRHGRSCTG